ncbi:hypothetical protein EPA93_36015 [Ktedonosporobacter rubrisoli]|uniref:Thioredoxin domain-containing protein n=1 Tax=Ktedonosporobacter rubrisoli TaxID=2509675 RepID=A0A4P6K0E0_KTERU|nr:thioredoxin domain-containing protein [Ktedonosporobacter rubrisoli]QBD81090.1 hypothetical protein EPA93_36015 [Ktedonosporobacter rubrisoli]
MAEWIDIEDEQQFEQEVQSHPQIVAIFGDSSNHMWRMSLGAIQGMADSVPPFIAFLHVDKPRTPQLFQKRNVTVVPTVRFIHEGKQVHEIKGNEVNPEGISKGMQKLQQAEQNV